MNKVLHVSECLPEAIYQPTEERAIKKAIKILLSKLKEKPCALDSVHAAAHHARLYINMALAGKEREVFLVLLLDNQHHLIEAVELFQGTIDGAAVYPREVVKAALARNAAAVILAHNHPSGRAEPSSADKQITERIQTALDLVDIRTLDHIIATANGTLSFAEYGLL